MPNHGRVDEGWRLSIGIEFPAFRGCKSNALRYFKLCLVCLGFCLSDCGGKAGTEMETSLCTH